MRETSKDFRLVEVLDKKEYEDGHIPGAINIPLDELEEAAKRSFKMTDALVVYCASYSCQASTKSARTLLELGYDRTMDFKGGKHWW